MKDRRFELKYIANFTQNITVVTSVSMPHAAKNRKQKIVIAVAEFQKVLQLNFLLKCLPNPTGDM